MYEISIRADTAEELADRIGGLAKTFGKQELDQRLPAPASAADADGLRRALRQIHGSDTRRFYADVADVVLRGESLQLDQALVDRYGKDSGQAFSGIQAGAVRVLDRTIHRRVIVTDPDSGGYSMSRDDARVVAEVYGKAK